MRIRRSLPYIVAFAFVLLIYLTWRGQPTRETTIIGTVRDIQCHENALGSWYWSFSIDRSDGWSTEIAPVCYTTMPLQDQETASVLMHWRHGALLGIDPGCYVIDSAWRMK